MHGPNAPSQKSRPGTISCPQTRRTQGASKRFASFPSTSQKRHSKRYPYPQRAKRGPAPDNWLSTSNLPRSLWLGTPPMLDRGYGNFSELRKSEVQLRRIPLPRTRVNKPSSRVSCELIKVGQQKHQYVSWQIIPLVAH